MIVLVTEAQINFHMLGKDLLSNRAIVTTQNRKNCVGAAMAAGLRLFSCVRVCAYTCVSVCAFISVCVCVCKGHLMSQIYPLYITTTSDKAHRGFSLSLSLSTYTAYTTFSLSLFSRHSHSFSLPLFLLISLFPLPILSFLLSRPPLSLSA